MLQIGRLVMIQRILMPPVIAILLNLLRMMRIGREPSRDLQSHCSNFYPYLVCSSLPSVHRRIAMMGQIMKMLGAFMNMSHVILRHLLHRLRPFVNMHAVALDID